MTSVSTPPRRAGSTSSCAAFQLVAGSDEQMLELSGPIYDGLYEYERRTTMLDGTPE